ncbi:MAG: ArsR family transcriptional regulator [Chloroflexi bacterium]|nr:ArsR family transcriptional regulator [Chloroflexota bacterium]
MQTTRQRILDYLEQGGSASARQLAHAFGMTPANLRRHLSILQMRGLVTPIGCHPAEGRGRPEQIYALKSTGKNSDLEPLARALLSTLAASGLPRRVDARSESLAKTLLGSFDPPSGQFTQRLVASVRRLEPLGYKPRWEARPQGPQMVLGRCPYAAIIADHPELCRMDAHLLEELLAAPVEQTAKLQPGPHRIPQCVFVMRQTV